jgi:hypothetical protein
MGLFLGGESHSGTTDFSGVLHNVWDATKTVSVLSPHLTSLDPIHFNFNDNALYLRGWLNWRLYKIWGCHSGHSEDLCLLGYNAVKSLEINRCFWGAFCLHIQARRISRTRNQRESRWQTERSTYRISDCIGGNWKTASHLPVACPWERMNSQHPMALPHNQTKQ